MYRMVKVGHHAPCIVSLSVEWCRVLYVGCVATKLHPDTALPDASRAGPEATGPRVARCNAQP